MPKIKYRATFADGHIETRKSHREYAAAWRYSYLVPVEGSDPVRHNRAGFSRTRALAERAAATEGRFAADRPGYRTEVAEAEKL